MRGICRLHGYGLRGRLLLRGGQHRFEIHVARLEIRRVGVGQVGGQHLGTLRAQDQGLCVDT